MSQQHQGQDELPGYTRATTDKLPDYTVTVEDDESWKATKFSNV